MQKYECFPFKKNEFFKSLIFPHSSQELKKQSILVIPEYRHERQLKDKEKRS